MKKERKSLKSQTDPVDLVFGETDDDDRGKFSFGGGYHEFRKNLQTKAHKMKHYADSVPKPKRREIPKQDISYIEKLPGTHILPPIEEFKHQSAEKTNKNRFDLLEQKRELLF